MVSVRMYGCMGVRVCLFVSHVTVCEHGAHLHVNLKQVAVLLRTVSRVCELSLYVYVYVNMHVSMLVVCVCVLCVCTCAYAHAFVRGDVIR